MSLFDFSILAQANAAVENATIGQMLSGLVVLFVMAASLAMIIVWVVRLGQSGHALPEAKRGVLRVPMPLTVLAIALSLLMFLLMLLVSIEDQIIPPPVAAAPAAATAENGGKSDLNSGQDTAAPDPAAAATPADAAEPSATTVELTPPGVPEKENEKPAADSAKTAKMTPGQMQTALVRTVMMDLILFVSFGVVVLLAGRHGRVHLTDTMAPGFIAAARDSGNAPGVPSNSLWPDLDDASAIPQLPGYAVLGERSIPAPLSAAVEPGDSFYAPSRDASFNPITDSGREPNSEADEPFSFLAELRWAGEVFLAAYLPTTFLRLLVVLLTVGLSGEEPAQHPFLEMMDAGVGTAVLALIVLTAVLCAPVVEELQFRVVILGGIAQVGRPVLALSISSILFAFAHGFPDSLALLPLAFALGYAYLRRRSYVTVMLVHFLFNGFNMALALLALL